MSSTNSNCSDGSDSTIRVEHQYDGDTPPSIAIVRAIAVIEDVDPMDSPAELGLTLFDHVDPTALDRLVAETPGRSTVTVDLTIHTDHYYCVRIRGNHLIVEKASSNSGESATD
ncbi:hypothetical protein Htur_3226 [Haloterrigena turkmenica DSM 5511]|uniref:Halobacterial output domain-containing protein n=1 Tax=Haloterrigena turkmenica (strain ATCC 51198 / DSM 5511 / JCM 9101 / NCIMB 13204 / VKM B-1734 / 4k) TaxID=543526 RepID=D2RZQ1_HALTV|nr:HalOD1 output domain-containing protein [Haloterrigena turkmenica]ADB62090.1 hypothetical protein Htur_3226 [Haloterrigena turkmenica DSM 5511]